MSVSLRKEKLTVLSATEQGIYTIEMRHGGSVLFEDLGFTPGNPIPAQMSRLEPEQLAAWNPDRLLLLKDAGMAASYQLERLQKSSVWSELAAVRSGRVTCESRGLWFEYTPHAHLWPLERAARLFGS